jgi:hypothetical protein
MVQLLLPLRAKEGKSAKCCNRHKSKNMQEFIYFNPHFLTKNNKFLYHARANGTSCKSRPPLLDVDVASTTGVRKAAGYWSAKNGRRSSSPDDVKRWRYGFLTRITPPTTTILVLLIPST